MLLDKLICKFILEYLKKFGEAKRTDFEDILLDKLPGVLNESRKGTKLKTTFKGLDLKGLYIRMEKYGKCLNKSLSKYFRHFFRHFRGDPIEQTLTA